MFARPSEFIALDRPRPHVAITGASGGIGRALVRAFGRAGYAITLVGRRNELLDDVAREVKGPTHLAAADFSDTERAADWMSQAETVLGPTDVLINNPPPGYPHTRRIGLLPTGTPETLARRVHMAVERRRPRVIHPSIYLLFGISQACRVGFSMHSRRQHSPAAVPE